MAAELTRLNAALAAAEARSKAAAAESAGLRSKVEATLAEVARLQERLGKAEAERDGIDARRRESEQKLAQAQSALADATRSVGLGDLLETRGLSRAEEHAAALAGLVDLRPAELLGALQLGPVDALTRLLDTRLALVCSSDDCQPDGEVVAVRVPPGRCEICGGSDLRAAFERFAEGLGRADIQAIVVVGGSPAGRRELRAVADRVRAPLRLDLVSGSSHRPRHKVEADTRRAQLVVLWGASRLDRSVSVAYRNGPARILELSERGITRMLDAVRRDVLAVARSAGRAD